MLLTIKLGSTVVGKLDGFLGDGTPASIPGDSVLVLSSSVPGVVTFPMSVYTVPQPGAYHINEIPIKVLGLGVTDIVAVVTKPSGEKLQATSTLTVAPVANPGPEAQIVILTLIQK